MRSHRPLASRRRPCTIRPSSPLHKPKLGRYSCAILNGEADGQPKEPSGRIDLGINADTIRALALALPGARARRRLVAFHAAAEHANSQCGWAWSGGCSRPRSPAPAAGYALFSLGWGSLLRRLARTRCLGRPPSARPQTVSPTYSRARIADVLLNPGTTYRLQWRDASLPVHPSRLLGMRAIPSTITRIVNRLPRPFRRSTRLVCMNSPDRHGPATRHVLPVP